MHLNIENTNIWRIHLVFSHCSLLLDNESYEVVVYPAISNLCSGACSFPRLSDTTPTALAEILMKFSNAIK